MTDDPEQLAISYWVAMSEGRDTDATHIRYKLEASMAVFDAHRLINQAKQTTDINGITDPNQKTWSPNQWANLDTNAWR